MHFEGSAAVGSLRDLFVVQGILVDMLGSYFWLGSAETACFVMKPQVTLSMLV